MIPFTRTITRTRYAAGTWGSAGQFTAGASASTSIIAAVQGATDQDMQSLDEGERRREAKRVYTTTQLRTVDQHNQTPADTLTIDGVVYQVRRVDIYSLVIPHYRAIAVRVQE